MRPAAAVGGMLALTCLLAGPAQAGTGHASTFYDLRKTPVGGGWLVTGYCGAVGVVTAGSSDVWTSASVVCTVNGAAFRSALPGPYAIAPVATATVDPITVCISGTATFVDVAAGVSYTDSTGTSCFPL